MSLGLCLCTVHGSCTSRGVSPEPRARPDARVPAVELHAPSVDASAAPARSLGPLRLDALLLGECGAFSDRDDRGPFVIAGDAARLTPGTEVTVFTSAGAATAVLGERFEHCGVDLRVDADAPARGSVEGREPVHAVYDDGTPETCVPAATLMSATGMGPLELECGGPGLRDPIEPVMMQPSLPPLGLLLAVRGRMPAPEHVPLAIEHRVYGARCDPPDEDESPARVAVDDPPGDLSDVFASAFPAEATLPRRELELRFDAKGVPLHIVHWSGQGDRDVPKGARWNAAWAYGGLFLPLLKGPDEWRATGSRLVRDIHCGLTHTLPFPVLALRDPAPSPKERGATYLLMAEAEGERVVGRLWAVGEHAMRRVWTSPVAVFTPSF